MCQRRIAEKEARSAEKIASFWYRFFSSTGIAAERGGEPLPLLQKYLAADDWVILPIFSPRPPDGLLTVTLHRKRAFAACFRVVVVVVRIR